MESEIRLLRNRLNESGEVRLELPLTIFEAIVLKWSPNC